MEDELQKARNYMKIAVAELPGGGTLEYVDYAKMAIAENSVNSFAKDNFSKECINRIVYSCPSWSRFICFNVYS